MSRLLPSVQQGLASINASEFPGPQNLSPELPTELQTAFALIVFHHLLSDIHSHTEDPWDRWSTARSKAERLQSVRQSIESIWTNFLSEYRSPLDIQTVLWAKFPLVEDGKPSVRAVDMLIRPASSPLVFDELISSSLSSTWKYGKILDSDSSSSWFARYDKFATPRAMHAVDITTQVAQLFILLHYVLHPPSKPTIYVQGFDYREIALVILAFSTIIRPGHLYAGNAILNLLAFLISFPAAPFPNELSFALLLLSAFVSILRLHVPSVPSPLLLFPPMHILPLATAIDQGSSRFYSPIMLFFLPLFLLSSFLLSFSLENTFFVNANADIITRSATPMESRLTFLILFAIVVTIIIPSSFFVITTFPLSFDPHISPWDRFTPAVSQASRKLFIKAVVQYASEHPFPAPFNLIQWPAYLVSKEKIVWRVTVAPCAIAVGLLMRYVP